MHRINMRKWLSHTTEGNFVLLILVVSSEAIHIKAKVGGVLCFDALFVFNIFSLSFAVSHI